MTEVSNIQNLEYGDIKIADDVVAIIASIAANEIEGVVDLKSGIWYDFSKKNTRGVKVNAEFKTVELDLSVVVRYGVKIQEVAKNVQKTVKENVEAMTDLEVVAVNIHVIGVQVNPAPSKATVGDE